MIRKITKTTIKLLMQRFSIRLKVATIAVLCVLSLNSIAQNCVWGSQSPAGTINVSSNAQTMVGVFINPGTYSVENFTLAGQYAIAASFGSYFTLTDNANNPIISGPNSLTVTIPSPGLYRIHLSANSSCGTGGGTRIVAINPLNRALNFDGANNNYVNLGTGLTTSLTGSTKVSVEAWVRPTSLSGLGVIVGNYSTGSGNLQVLLRRNTNSYYEFWVGNGSNIYATNSVATPTLNVWQHVAGTWDGTVAKIYVNGVLSATTTPPISTLGNGSNNPVWIGANTISENFTGDIDEVRIWNRALCQGEIQNNRNGEISTTSPGLLANYHFNQGIASGTNTSVTSLTDDGGNSYTGTLSGFTLTGSTSNWVAPGAFGDGIYATAFVSPTVSISGANGICSGASTTFTASGNVSTYNWLSGPTTATNSVSPTTTTTYSVVGTNSLGCLSNTATITLTVSSISTSSAVTNVSCNGGTNGSATVTATGGISPYTYLASNGYTTSTLPSLVAGTYNYTVTDNIGCTKSQALIITQPTALATSTAVTNVSCNGGSTGSATLTVSGGTTPYSYMASNGYTTSTLPSLVAGTYNYTVTDNNGCTKTQVLNVTQPTALSLTASANNATICSGASSTLTANGTGGTGTITYTWVGGPTNSTYVVSPTSPTNYTVNITDANSCTKTATAGVVANVCTAGAALNFDGSNDRVNLGNGISTSLTGGTNISVEAWVKPTSLSGLGVIVGNYQTGAGANLQILLRRSGSSYYEFFVGNGTNFYSTNSVATPTLNVWQHVAGTWDGTVAKIYVNGVLSATTTPPISTLGNSVGGPVWIGGNTVSENFTGNIDEVRVWNIVRTQCEINTYKDYEIPTTATGLIANYHFNQGNDAGTNTSVTTLTDATATNTGTLTNFNLTGATSNWVAPGAVTSGSAAPTFTPVSASISSQVNVLCNGYSNGSFDLTPSGGTAPYTFVWSNAFTSEDMAGLAAGIYSVTITDAKMCKGTQTVNITEPAALVVGVAASATTICTNEVATVTISATGGTAAYSGVGTYTTNAAANNYTVTDVNNCVATATLNIVVNPLPTVTVNSGAVCAGQSFTMIPSGATTYVYSNGTDVVTPTANDSYTITGTDANGCENTAVSSVTVNALPVLTAVTNNTLLCAGQTATLTVSGATTYTWSTSANTTTVAVSPTVQTTYTVNGTDANGCSNNTTVTQNVSACTGIATLSNDASINVYPNPNNGLFVIELTTVSKVTVTNALGQVVIAEIFEAGKHTVSINNEMTGVYFVKVMTNNGQQTIKVIKE